MKDLHPSTGLQVALTIAVFLPRLGITPEEFIAVFRAHGAAQAANGNTELALSMRALADTLEAEPWPGTAS